MTQENTKRPGLTIARINTSSEAGVYDSVDWTQRDAVIKGADGKVFFEQRGVEFPTSWSQTATDVVAQKYFRGTLGTPEREYSVRQMIGRVANTIHGWGKADKYFASDADALAFQDELTHLLLHQKMAFNSPVWFNVGVEEHPQSSACFINSVDDSMESILGLAKTEGMLFKQGSGTGTNLSSLRSSREHLNGGGTASGPVSFMRGFDAFAGAIKSGGKTRRAAKMVILDIDHPDVVDFIDCKAIEEQKAGALVDAGYDGGFNVAGGAYDSVNYQNANHSVRVTDDFMHAVHDDCEWQTRNVTDGEPADTYRARDLLRKMAQAAWTCGDPGIQFDTACNTWHTCPNTARINASNPCQPAMATVLTPEGVCTFADIDVGSTIWSGQRWTKVVRKVATGIKPVFKFSTTHGTFLGTKDHKVMSRGERVSAIDADIIDVARTYGATASETRSAVVYGVEYVGELPVWDIEVDALEHTYWTDGLLVSNCSEYMFLDDSACNLASLNLRKFEDDHGNFDVDAFKHAIRITIIAMEIIVGNSSYPTHKIAENSRKFRPLGLGYANLGALLMARGLPYDSDSARQFAAGITSLMCGYAYQVSAEIAYYATGTFDGYADNSEPFLEVIDRHASEHNLLSLEYIPEDIYDAGSNAWRNALVTGTEHGFHNAQTTVLAPTGTIVFLMDCDTTGVEPDIALVKYKRLVGGGLIKIANRTVEEALEKLGYPDEHTVKILKYIEDNDTVEGAPHLKDEHLPVFDCAFRSAKGTRSISYMGHIRMMAAVQPFLSGAISKTVNLPTDCTVEDIEKAYIQAWEFGLKAIAVYRDGCKRTQPLSTSLKQATSTGAVQTADNLTTEEQALVDALRARKAHPAGQPMATRYKLADERAALTHKFSVGGHEGYITVGMYADKTPGEIFVRMAKEGSVIAGLMDSFATAISLALQHGVPLPVMIEKFKGTRFEPSGFTGNPEVPLATSIMDYLFRWLSLRFGAPTVIVPESTVLATPVHAAQTDRAWVQETDAPPCYECGTLTVRSGACRKCPNCGSTSGCS